VSGSGDNTIRIWNAATGEAVGTPLEGHTELVSSVAFSPDGTQIVSGSGDNTIRIWNGALRDVVDPTIVGHILFQFILTKCLFIVLSIRYQLANTPTF
jgi:WD40 repeat protein